MARKKDRSPEELRLNNRNGLRAEEPAARPEKTGRQERSSDRLEGHVRKEQPVSVIQQALETAYKPTEHMPVEGHDLPGRGREDSARAEVPFASGASVLTDCKGNGRQEPPEGRNDKRASAATKRKDRRTASEGSRIRQRGDERYHRKRSGKCCSREPGHAGGCGHPCYRARTSV